MLNFSIILNSLANRVVLVTIPRIALCIFILFQIMGMIFYPGGTMHDESTLAYSFSNNFFSDLGIYKSYNGSPNYVSMILFSLSLTIVGFTFSVYYLSLIQFFKKDKLNYILSIIGTAFAIGSAIGLIGTGFTPADVVLDAHVFFANNIFYCFTITAFCYTVVFYRTNILETKYAMGYAFFFISIAIYVGILIYGPSPRTNASALLFTVVSQKVIVLIFCWSIFYQTFGFANYNFNR